MGKRYHTISTKHYKCESKSHHGCEAGRTEFKVTAECYCKKARHQSHGKCGDRKSREACVVCCNSEDRTAHVCTFDNSRPQQKRIQSCGLGFDEPRKCVTPFDAFNAGTAAFSPQYASGPNVAYGGSLIQNDYAAHSAQAMGVEGRRFPEFSQDQLCQPYKMDHGVRTRFW
ncbi:hypothetical protein AAHC03_05195 [Spirometra sp. Aus1]